MVSDSWSYTHSQPARKDAANQNLLWQNFIAYIFRSKSASNKVLPQKILVCCVFPGRSRTRVRVGAEIRDKKTWDEKTWDEKTLDGYHHRRKEDPSFWNQNCGSW